MKTLTLTWLWNGKRQHTTYDPANSTWRWHHRQLQEHGKEPHIHYGLASDLAAAPAAATPLQGAGSDASAPDL